MKDNHRQRKARQRRARVVEHHGKTVLAPKRLRLPDGYDLAHALDDGYLDLEEAAFDADYNGWGVSDG